MCNDKKIGRVTIGARRIVKKKVGVNIHTPVILHNKKSVENDKQSSSYWMNKVMYFACKLTLLILTRFFLSVLSFEMTFLA